MKMRSLHTGVSSSALVVLLSMLVTACGGTPLVQRPWVEVSTPNFRVMSSLDEQRTVKLAQELESFRAVVAQLLSIPLPERDVPTHVYVFDDQDAWDELAPSSHLDGYFGSDWRHAVMAINAVGTKTSRAIVQHEYVHRILDQSGSSYPQWYEEGIAELFSTAVAKDLDVKLGAPPPRFGVLRIAQPARFGPRSRVGSNIVRENTSAAADGDMFYARAWARVNYLHLAHVSGDSRGDLRVRLHAFLQLFNQGKPEEEAFVEAFGMTLTQLDEQVDAYLREDKLPLVTIRVQAAASAEPRVQPMSQGDVARALAELALRTGKRDRAAALFEDALAIRPDDARAMSGLARVRVQQQQAEEARRLFESALQTAPKDPIPRLDHALYLLATLDGPGTAAGKEIIANARAHIQVAIAEAPDMPEPYALLGLTYVMDKDSPPREGIQALARAGTLLPRDGAIYFNLATLLLRVDEVEEARALLRIVQVSRHGNDLAERAAELLRALDQTGQ